MNIHRRSSFGCHIADSDVEPEFFVREMNSGGRGEHSPQLLSSASVREPWGWCWWVLAGGGSCSLMGGHGLVFGCRSQPRWVWHDVALPRLGPVS